VEPAHRFLVLIAVGERVAGLTQPRAVEASLRTLRWAMIRQIIVRKAMASLSARC